MTFALWTIFFLAAPSDGEADLVQPQAAQQHEPLQTLQLVPGLRGRGLETGVETNHREIKTFAVNLTHRV